MDRIYPKGITSFAPRNGAPAFVLGTVVISLNDFFAWAKENEKLLTEYKGIKQLRLNVLQGKENRLNFQVDTWKPEQKEASKARQPEPEEPNDLPF